MQDDPFTIHHCPKCGYLLSRFTVSPKERKAGAGRPRTIELPESVFEEYARGGVSVRILSERLGVSSVTIRKRLIEKGVKKPPLWSLLPDSIQDQYEAGATILQIANEQKSKPADVAAKLRKLGTTMRDAASGKMKVHRQDMPDVLKRFDDGETLDSIAETYSVTRERIRQLVAREGRSPRIINISAKAVERAARLRSYREKRAALRYEKIKKLSESWKSGASMRQVARDNGYSVGGIRNTVYQLRKEFPELFPNRDTNWVLTKACKISQRR